ncbi:hypothetical protein ABK040_014409 [Willaertia magna]
MGKTPTPKPSQAKKAPRKKIVAPNKPPIPSSSTDKTKKPKTNQNTNALKEIRKYQKSTDLLIPKKPFIDLVKETMQDMSETHGVPSNDKRIQAVALQAIQSSAEDYLVEIFEIATELTVHAKRSTLLDKDYQLAVRLVERFTKPAINCAATKRCMNLNK